MFEFPILFTILSTIILCSTRRKPEERNNNKIFSLKIIWSQFSYAVFTWRNRKKMHSDKTRKQMQKLFLTDLSISLFLPKGYENSSSKCSIIIGYNWLHPSIFKAIYKIWIVLSTGRQFCDTTLFISLQWSRLHSRSFVIPQTTVFLL